jgi:hypothetical protein
VVQVRRIAVNHGIVDVFAFQEALLIEAVFGIVLLAMIWAGFRRWLQHKEKMDRLIADQTAAHIARLEARLNAIEQRVTDGVETTTQIDFNADEAARR